MAIFSSLRCPEAVTQSCSTKYVPKNFAILTGKHLCWSVYFKIKLHQPATLLTKRLRCRCIFVNFANFLRYATLKMADSECLEIVALKNT